MELVWSSSGRISWKGVKRIAVFRALYLGDLLCAVPALRALRQAAPGAHITFIGMPWAKELLDRFPHYVDAFLEFPGFPGLPEQVVDRNQLRAFFNRARTLEFDLAIQLHGSGERSNRVCALLHARALAGHYPAGHKCPDYRTFLPYPSGVSEVLLNLQLLRFLGAPAVSEELEFPVHDEDRARLSRLLRSEGCDHRDLICLHAGGKLSTRRWPAERFAQVGNALAEQGYHIVLTGTEPERPLIDGLAAHLHQPHTNLCGKTTLGTLAALVQRACLVVTNDTGVSHLATATNTPSVVVFLGSDPARWAPLDQHTHHVVLEDVSCRPCDHVRCPIGFPCAKRVAAPRVLEAARRLLTSPLVPPPGQRLSPSAAPLGSAALSFTM